MILVFGILGLIVCMPFGTAAWVMGNSDLKSMDAGTMDPEGRGLTQAGKVLGIIATLLAVLSFVLGILLLAGALVLPAVANAG
jgi:hypothetical protein